MCVQPVLQMADHFKESGMKISHGWSIRRTLCTASVVGFFSNKTVWGDTGVKKGKKKDLKKYISMQSQRPT